MRNRTTSLRTIITFLLSLSIATTSQGIAYAKVSSSVNSPSSRQNLDKYQLEELRSLSADLAMDPTLKIIGSDKETRLEIGIQDNDPLLDQDPFFLGQQAWIASAKSDDILVRKNNDSIEIVPEYSSVALRLNLPLEPILQTDRYLFFSAVEEKNILIKNGKSFGEGIFAIEISDLQDASSRKSRVPVYFFPMPGQGWVTTLSKAVSGYELPHQDLIVFTDSNGFSLPVKPEDIATVLKIEKLNQVMAFAMRTDSVFSKAQSNQNLLKDAKTKFQKAFSHTVQNPNSENSITDSYHALEEFSIYLNDTLKIDDRVLAPGSTAAFGMQFTGREFLGDGNSDWFKSVSSKNIFSGKIASVFNFLVPQAHALDLHPELVNFLHSAGRVFAIVGGVYISGIAARYTLLRDTIRRQEVAKGTRIGFVRGSFDILAHSLTTIFQIPFVWPSNIIEYFKDRAGVSNHGMIQKIYNWTFGYTRMSNNRTPVNSRTLLYGVVFLGLMDTGLVAFQTYLLVPLIGKGLMLWAPEFIAQRAYAAWGVPNPDIALYNLVNVLYNLTSYITAGAYAYAHDVQDIKTNEALRIVSSEMKEEGKDLTKFKSELSDRIDHIVRASLHKQGLPGDIDFMFDAGTIYRSVQSWAGYTVPDSPDPNLSEPNNYLAIQRQGLNGRAIENAVNALNEAPRSVENIAALEMLRDLQSDFHFFGNFLKSPQSYLNPGSLIKIGQRMRAARAKLVAITYLKNDGQLDVLIPQEWKDKNIDGAIVAALTYREQLENLTGVTDSNTVQAEKELDPSKRESRFSRWQMKNAIRKATKTINRNYGRNLTDELAVMTIDNPILAEWKLLIEANLVQANGLRPDLKNSELNVEVQRRTNAEMDLLRVSDGFPAYFAKLDPREVARIEATLAADIYTKNYIEATQAKDDFPSDSPSQPGVFQKMRQVGFFRRSKTGTGALRAVEALFSDSHYERGGFSLAKRTIPLVADLWDGNVRTMRETPVKAVFEYLWVDAIFKSVLPYPKWWTNHLFRGSTIKGPWATTNRMMVKLGMKPGSKISSMLVYAGIGSFATFTGMVPYGLFHSEITLFFNSIGAFVLTKGAETADFIQKCGSTLGL